MLKTFLKDNKISLARLTSPVKMVPASSPTIPLDKQPEERQKPMSEPLIAIDAVRSPTSKRRKIFERISSPESKITADFGELPNYSTVQSYPIPREPQGRTPKRNMLKTNKENGLCLARATSKDLQKDFSRKNLHRLDPEAYELPSPDTNEHLQSFAKGESQRQQRVEDLQRYNRVLERQLKEKSRKVQQGSLLIVEATSDFTFQSDKSSISPKSSLSYSNSLRGSFKEQSMHLTLIQTLLNSPLDSQLHR